MLICVKRLDGSDKMSHLFAQGSVSVSLMSEPDYQEFTLNGLREIGASADFGSPSDWTVIFAIATSRPGHIKELLPFFAKAALRANLDAIKSRGYRVALAKVERIPKPPAR
jgi:uncharacterized protein (TIGR04141 family)